MLDASIDDVDHAFGADLENQIWMLVKIFGAVDEGQMMHSVDPFHGALHEVGGTYVTDEQFYTADSLPEAPLSAARIVIEDTDAVTVLQQSQYEGRTDESGSAGDEVSLC